jgi:uncharacterized protein YjbI with pentapeptide repeats
MFLFYSKIANIMANKEQLSILKQGVTVWNDWRRANPDPYFSPDLTNASLANAFLGGVNLYRANLNRADLRRANLTGAILVNAVFIGADLRDATLDNTRLTSAGLTRANLRGAKLVGADLQRANLMEAILNGVDLSSADLHRASLISTNLTDAILDKVNFLGAELGDTIFGNVNLSQADGLENARHRFPSMISSATMQLSQGEIPAKFMQGCGLTDWEIASVKLYNPDLENDEISQVLYEMYNVRATQAFQISRLFISYSHVNGEFVDKLGTSLTQKGIRYWRDVNNMTAGPMEQQIDRAIRLNPILLLVLSEHSLSSDWVEHEVRAARELEKEMRRHVLCPVSLDDSWKESKWEKRVMEQVTKKNILDFSAWKDDRKFDEQFRKLIDGLGLFYKGQS